MRWIPALALTGVLLAALLVWDPFAQVIAALKSAASAVEGAKVTHYFSDSATQEVSNGQHPLSSLRLLEARWCAAPADLRYVLSGNSQTMTVMLAPSESPSPEAAKTYPDILLEHLTASGFRGHGYRLSAPNLSYVEVLWYLVYLSSHPCLVPNQFVIQLNFETFRKAGVRDGMLELLADPKFAAAAGQESRMTGAYSGAFQQAIDRYESMLADRSGKQAGAASTSGTGLTQSAGLGGSIETLARKHLDQLPAFKTRGVLKSELLEIMYFLRVNLLGITPATKRSLGGGTLAANVSALERVGEICRDAGIRLVYFNAPQNPSAPLYRTAADRDAYQQIITRLARTDAQAYFDFEASIPAPLWGVWVDGPDPIHFGRAAHQRLADLMFDGNVILRAH
jgi:hypothetical protein